ncbi:hypothetical protein [Amycolatopsis mediterranei]|uniref:Uncharacterized protein n=1 Tax=Amycolatopsis mediterranei (strain S699) TaxID=713604 RepID=A0A9R0P6R3_AMYMS|nr:hypothetical protein [Amycolatopsis mediterranei]AEK47257.1 hypothetical protein RAM_43950 [Amycolatopsis mediterranei S699]KDO08358.1 hypothetical protein DV26_24705 [Amycolatopsis mediterranei]KDU93612.1 hypothetical protein DV36_06070 [Amycolatopsis mediterranei]UZF75239.1 hypothetical protein ISP_008823 [Amycolatopsis mediterranei]
MSDRRDPAEARLRELLCAWRREVDEVPVPSLVDPVHAAAVVIEAMKAKKARDGGRVHPPPDGARTRPPGDAREEAV